MKMAYIAIMVILVMGLAACSSEEMIKQTMETVAVIEITEATEPAVSTTVGSAI